MKKIIILGLTGLTILIFSFISTVKSHALVVDDICQSVDVVYARGSGQKLEDGESERFREQIIDRMGDVGVNYYELGTETYDNAKYPAITVGEWWKNGNAIGASLSAGLANDYGNSVNSGITELKSYLSQRHEKCPNSRIILGGYSQGAQVIGQTLPKLATAVQENIDFVALFGDPKLHLPEGEGIYPDACRGINLSPWRRTIGDCHADNGSLSARKPFLPKSMENKTGLWCRAKDFVCGTSKLVYDVEGHGEYKNDGDAIDQSALEIAYRLKSTLPLEKANGVSTLRKNGIGANGMDVVFLLNPTGTTPERFEKMKDFIRQFAHRLEAENGRITLAGYIGGDNWAGYSFTDYTPNRNYADFHTILNGYTLHTPEPSVQPTLRAAMDAFRHYSWSENAIKSLIIVSDSEFYNPDDYGRITIDVVARRALEIDPVNIYPVVPQALRPSFQELANATSASIITSDGDMSSMLNEATKKVVQRPTALLKNTEYAAVAGQEITFDASNSYAVDGSLTKYEWDFDGNGTFEAITTDPIVKYAYTDDIYRGIMQLRITDSNNVTSNISANIKIGLNYEQYIPLAPDNLSYIVKTTVNNVSTVTLDWTTTDENIASWQVSLNDIPLGVLSSAQKSVEVANIIRNDDAVLSVAGVLSDGSVGLSSSVTLAKATSIQPEPAPTIGRPVSNWPDFVYELLRKRVPSLPHFR